MKRSCSIQCLLSLSIFPSFIFNGVPVCRQTHTSLTFYTLRWPLTTTRKEQINTQNSGNWEDTGEYLHYVLGHIDVLRLNLLVCLHCLCLLVWSCLILSPFSMIHSLLYSRSKILYDLMRALHVCTVFSLGNNLLWCSTNITQVKLNIKWFW